MKSAGERRANKVHAGDGDFTPASIMDKKNIAHNLKRRFRKELFAPVINAKLLGGNTCWSFDGMLHT